MEDDAMTTTKKIAPILILSLVWWEIPTAGEGATRFLTPGHPERSSILARMKSRRPSTQMPPLGTVSVDQEASALIEAWIRRLNF